MALQPCHECGKEISTKAAACPSCGAKRKRKVGAVGIVAAIVLGIAVFKVVSGPVEAPAEPIAAAPQVSAEERARIIAAATATMEAERDKIERITFYTAKKRDYLSPRLEAYLSVPDASKPLLRMSVTYFGDNWVFFDRVKVLADDIVVYEKSFSRSDVSTHNSSGSVWETADYLAGLEDERALRKIASSKNATIRFSGREDQHDHNLTDQEFTNLREALSARDAMAKL